MTFWKMEKIIVKNRGKCPKLPWMIDFHRTEGAAVLDHQLEAIDANKHLEYLGKLSVKSQPSRRHLTQFACVIPNGTDEDHLEELLRDGMGMAVLDVWHYDLLECEEMVDTIRKSVKKYSKTVGRTIPLAIALNIEGLNCLPNETPSEIVLAIMKLLVEKSVPSNTSFPQQNDGLIRLILEEKIDLIFSNDIVDTKTFNYIKRNFETIPIFTVIQNLETLSNVDELIRVSDGIVFDTTRLSLNLNNKIFVAQKSVIAKCNQKGKAIWCTYPMPEVFSKKDYCDLAQMIIEGIDGIIVDRLDQDLVLTCKEAEASVHQKALHESLVATLAFPAEPIYSLALSCVVASTKSNAAAIVVLTVSGRSAKIISRFRPRCPILALTRYERVARQLHAYRGVLPLFYTKPIASSWQEDVEERLQAGVTYGKRNHLIRMGDSLVILRGSYPGSGFTNDMRLVYATEYDTHE